MSQNQLLNNIFLILFVNFAFFGFFANEVYGINYSYEIPASKILLSDKSYEIPLKIKDHKDLSSLEHVKINLKINDYHNTTSISITWSQLDGKELVTVDENKFLRDVTVTALTRGFLEFQFEFTPTTELELRSISADVLKQKPIDIKKSAKMQSPNNSEVIVLKESESNYVKVQNNEEESTLLESKKDQMTQHGIGRNTSFFDSYRQGQQLLAEETFNMLVGHKNIQNEQFGKNYKETFYAEHLSRSEDIHLKNAILKEILRAQEFFKKHYQVHYNFDK